MPKHECQPWEISNHHYRPLDGVAGIVGRLFCTRCGRVIYAVYDIHTLIEAAREPEVPVGDGDIVH